MACFLVPTGEAIVATVIAQGLKRSEMKAESVRLAQKAEKEQEPKDSLPWSKKLMLLTYLLWGGAILLCFEHIWHGEVVPWIPFLTAMNDPGDAAEMLHEMATVGVTMAVIVTVVWGIMIAVIDRLLKRPDNAKAAA